MFDRQLAAHESTVVTVVAGAGKKEDATLPCAVTCLQVVPEGGVGVGIAVVDGVQVDLHGVVVVPRVVLGGFAVVELVVGVLARALEVVLLADVLEGFGEEVLAGVADGLVEVLDDELETSLAAGELAGVLLEAEEVTLFALLLVDALGEELVVLLRVEVDRLVALRLALVLDEMALLLVLLL